MLPYKILLAFLGVIAVDSATLADNSAVFADNILVAEFRADQSGVSEVLAGPGSNYGLDYPIGNYPIGLYTDAVGQSRARSWSIGQYKIAGVVNWGHRTHYLAGRPYSDRQFLSLGSKLWVGDTIETYLYYGYGRDQLSPVAGLFSDLGDAHAAWTGLSQTLYFADRRASVGVGYEYATGSRENLYQDRQGHRIDLTGELALGWGFDAYLEAGYGLYSYDQYGSVGRELSSAMTNMRAGISHSFTPSLSWGLHYSYIDEQFDLSKLSQTRETWGLNLEYRY